LDVADRVAATPDFLLERDDVLRWVDEHAPLPDGGWLLYRTGWDARSADQDAFLNADKAGSHTPGVSAECARWLAAAPPIAGLGAGDALGVVGSGDVALANAVRAHGVPFVAARHEGGAATVADADGRMSGRVAVVTTHQGCGFADARTGIGEAAKSRTPLLV